VISFYNKAGKRLLTAETLIPQRFYLYSPFYDTYPVEFLIGPAGFAATPRRVFWRLHTSAGSRECVPSECFQTSRLTVRSFRGEDVMKLVELQATQRCRGRARVDASCRRGKGDALKVVRARRERFIGARSVRRTWQGFVEAGGYRERAAIATSDMSLGSEEPQACAAPPPLVASRGSTTAATTRRSGKDVRL